MLNPYAGLFAPAVAIAGSTGLMASSVPQSPAPVVQAFKHSGAYKARLKIHKIANFATLPLCHEGQVIARSMACPHQHAAVRWLERHSGFSAPSTIPSSQPSGADTSGRTTRNLDRFPIRRDGDAVVVNVTQVFTSNEDAAGWTSATVPV